MRSTGRSWSLVPDGRDLTAKVPACLFNHLIGCGKQRVRYREAERLCGLKVDDQFKFRGLDDRKFADFLI